MSIWELAILWAINRVFVGTKNGLIYYLVVWPRKHVVEFVVWIVMLIIILASVYSFVTFGIQESALAKRHEVELGTFLKYEGFHSQFTYAFVVHGVKFYGTGSSSEHQIQNIQSGEPFEVYYDPDNPSISSVSEPVENLAVTRAALMSLSGLPIGFIAIFIRKLGILRADAAK